MITHIDALFLALAALFIFGVADLLRRSTVPRAAARSAARFLALVAHKRLHQPKERLGARVDDYVAFRETRRHVDAPGRAVLLAWFRLRFVEPDNALRAKIFRRICILTTPFFSGVPGFIIKLWMEDRSHARYLGVYEFEDADTAARYADYITRVIRVFAVPGSVASEIIDGTNVADYLASAPHAPAPVEERAPRARPTSFPRPSAARS